jgi:hypothetical protein
MARLQGVLRDRLPDGAPGEDQVDQDPAVREELRQAGGQSHQHVTRHGRIGRTVEQIAQDTGSQETQRGQRADDQQGASHHG